PRKVVRVDQQRTDHTVGDGPQPGLGDGGESGSRGGAQEPAELDAQRGGAAGRFIETTEANSARMPYDKPLWFLGGSGGCDLLSGCRGCGTTDGADRPSHREYTELCAGPVYGAGSVGCDRGGV